MWLTKKLTEHPETLRAAPGVVTAGQTAPAVQAEREYRGPDMLAPYGVCGVPPGGFRSVMLGGYCAGIQPAREDLLSGEICLYSAGGAEILLKNNGEVRINGQRFAPEGS